jgi:hypothetical protein
VRVPIAFLVLLATSFAVDKKATPQDLVPLSVSSSKELATPSVFYMGNAQCDDKGDIFFLSGSQQTRIVYKLMSDGSHDVYGLLGEDARNYYNKAFHADRDGRVSLLEIEGRSGRAALFSFGEDSTEPPARTTLDVPPEMDSHDMRSFIQLKTGHILLQGFFGEGAPAKNRGLAYIAEFDASGKLLHTFMKKDGYKVEEGQWVGHVSPLEGDDGFIYVLLPDKVLVLSQMGRVRKTIKLSLPEGYVAFQMYLAGSRLAIGYYKPGSVAVGKVTMMEPLYALFDASSGRQLRAYKPVDELAKSLLVGFSDEGFIFYRSGRDGKVHLLTARAD